MLLLIDLTSYTTNMKNKILKKRLYIIVDIKCKDSVIRKKGSKTRNLYKNLSLIHISEPTRPY